MNPAAELCSFPPMSPHIKPPPVRRLRGYAFDPSLSTTLDTVGINETTFAVRWEKLVPGPVGEYLEVVDHDPASGRFYEPVDLEHPHVLAQEGLVPSESLPQAHQQMVYAVAMTTIRNFEKALGRKALWLPLRNPPPRNPKAPPTPDFVQRLRIYPHGLRGANAYYSPDQRALLFGYFKADEADGVHAPGSTVFTCLSHDIIAHETTHALLDGMHRRFIEPTHPDSLAFHEAFADLVALFQHFSFPGVLQHQIAKTRGDLKRKNLLAELAQEFGRALGQHGALRNALGVEPDPDALATTMEPHDRGAILVAAMFEAFNNIYGARASKLIRMATAGSGVLPPGALPALLVDELAKEAAKTAEHFLNMCIRALDYCPPVGLTFGDYLRALVTADRDMVPEDTHGYRIALIDAFRRRGIFAPGVSNLSEECLAWPSGADLGYDARWLQKQLRRTTDLLRYEGNRRLIAEKSRDAARELHNFLTEEPAGDLFRFGEVCGLALNPKTAPPGIAPDRNGVPKFEVHQVRTAFRARPDGTLMNHVILVLMQRRRIKLADGDSYEFRGGATLIFDLDTDELELRHCIRRPITDETRRAAYEAYMRDELPPAIRKKFFSRNGGEGFEPFAFLHGEDWKGDNHA